MASNKPGPAPSPNNRQPQLEQAQQALEEALSQASRVNARDADTGELIRIEEVLAIANEAAKEAISLRRMIRRERREPGFRGRDGERLPGDETGDGVETHRIVEDARGVRWDVCAIYSPIADVEHARPVEHDGGWLTFDSGMERRRATPIPGRWLAMTDDDLLKLCDEAGRG